MARKVISNKKCLELRKQLGLTREAMSQKLGLSPNTVYLAERRGVSRNNGTALAYKKLLDEQKPPQETFKTLPRGRVTPDNKNGSQSILELLTDILSSNMSNDTKETVVHTLIGGPGANGV